MQNIYKINYVTITPANINGVWHYRLYVNQQSIGDYTDIKLATDKLNSMVNEEKSKNKQVEKFCTGCGTSSFKKLGNNEHGEPYLACCPDNNYVELPTEQPELDNITLLEAAKPLIKYLNDNHHPMCTAIVNLTGVVILESIKCENTDEFFF